MTVVYHYHALNTVSDSLTIRHPASDKPIEQIATTEAGLYVIYPDAIFFYKTSFHKREPCFKNAVECERLPPDAEPHDLGPFETVSVTPPRHNHVEDDDLLLQLENQMLLTTYAAAQYSYFVPANLTYAPITVLTWEKKVIALVLGFAFVIGTVQDGDVLYTRGVFDIETCSVYHCFEGQIAINAGVSPLLTSVYSQPFTVPPSLPSDILREFMELNGLALFDGQTSILSEASDLKSVEASSSVQQIKTISDESFQVVLRNFAVHKGAISFIAGAQTCFCDDQVYDIFGSSAKFSFAFGTQYMGFITRKYQSITNNVQTEIFPDSETIARISAYTSKTPRINQISTTDATMAVTKVSGAIDIASIPLPTDIVVVPPVRQKKPKAASALPSSNEETDEETEAEATDAADDLVAVFIDTKGKQINARMVYIPKDEVKHFKVPNTAEYVPEVKKSSAKKTVKKTPAKKAVKPVCEPATETESEPEVEEVAPVKATKKAAAKKPSKKAAAAAVVEPATETETESEAEPEPPVKATKKAAKKPSKKAAVAVVEPICETETESEPEAAVEEAPIATKKATAKKPSKKAVEPAVVETETESEAEPEVEEAPVVKAVTKKKATAKKPSKKAVEPVVETETESEVEDVPKVTKKKTTKKPSKKTPAIDLIDLEHDKEAAEYLR